MRFKKLFSLNVKIHNFVLLTLKNNPFSFSFLGNNIPSILHCFSSKEVKQSYIDKIMSKTSFSPRVKPLVLFSLEGILRSLKSNKEFPKKKRIDAEGFVSFDFFLPYSDRAKLIINSIGRRAEVRSKFYNFSVFCRSNLSFLPSQVTQSAIIKRGNSFFYSLTLSERLEVQEEVDLRKGVERSKILGIDLNVGKLVCTSPNNQTICFEPPFEVENKIRKLEARIRRLSKKQGKRVSKSKENKTALPKNYHKTQRKIRRDYSKIANIRNNYIHNLTSNILSCADILFLENLRSQRLMDRKNKTDVKSTSKDLSNKIKEASFFKIIKQLEYKSERSGRILKFINPYNTSKACSKCGFIIEGLKLQDRIFICPKCGNTMDRDVNASMNILHNGLKAENMKFSLCEGLYKKA